MPWVLSSHRDVSDWLRLGPATGTASIALQVYLCPNSATVSTNGLQLSFDIHVSTRKGGDERGAIPIGDNYTITSCQFGFASNTFYTRPACTLSITVSSQRLQMFVYVPSEELGTLFIDNVKFSN